MPDVKPGESKSAYMKRCVPYYIRKGLTPKAAKGRCYGMYKNKHNKNADKYEEFTFEVPMIKIPMKEELNDDNEPLFEGVQYAANKGQRHAVALVGDRFYKGKFMPAKELKKAHKLWEGTLHDINHMGTTYITGFFAIPNILYFVGYNSNVKWDNKTNSVSMDINIRDDTKYAKDWRAYVALCEEAGQIPNVSVAFNAQVKYIKAKELPKGVDYKIEGYKKDDFIPYICDIQPQALSTVLKGACDDKKGCGIGIQHNEDNEHKEEYGQKEAIIKWLKENK